MNLKYRAERAPSASPEDGLLADVFKRLEETRFCFAQMKRWSTREECRRFASQQLAVRQRLFAELSATLQGPGDVLVSRRLLPSLRRGLLRLRGRLPRTQRQVLNRTDRGETGLLYAYLLALEANPASPAVRDLLQRQQGEVTQAQRDLRQLRTRP